MTQEQSKHLKEKLQSVYAAKMAKVPSKYGALPKFPPDIAHAARMEKKYERIVQKWKDRQYKKNEAIRNRISSLCESARTVILFGTPAQALAAIRKFERQA